MAENFLESIGKAIIPKKFRPNLKGYLLKAGYTEVPYQFFGGMFVLANIMTYFAFFSYFLAAIKKNPSFITQFLLYFVTWAVLDFIMLFVLAAIIYFYWNIRIYNRTKELEALLPDYLTLVSTNLKGGMSFENALWGAIKPEFGILANEIGLVSKRVMTGNDVGEALIDFSMKYESPILRRNIQLLISEVESGGKIAEVIDRVIYSMKKTQILKKEMVASTVTYMIFIGTLVILICPVLFALSLQLFTIIQSFVANLAGTTTGVTTLTISEATITPGDFEQFSVGAIAIIAIFSSFIIATIEKGEVRSGIKYIPMFLISALVLYFLFLAILGYSFSALAFG